MSVSFRPFAAGFASFLVSPVAVAQDGAAQSFPSMFNPSISVNGLFLGSFQANDGEVVKVPPPEGEDDPDALPGQGETFGTGLSIQEVEVQFKAAVDPYFQANFILAIPGIEGIEIEEGYATLVFIPRVLINVGKLKEPFGRENLVHTHALMTIDRALVSQRVFGGEGLNDVAINAAVLLPLPWYAEITLGVDAGSNAVVLASGDPVGFGYMGHLKNVIDLGPGTTIEVGASGLTGPNAYGGLSVVAGADVTLKSRGHGMGQWRRFVWQTEYLYASVPGADEDEVGGLYTTIEGSWSKRFWLGGRFDAVGLPAATEPTWGGTLIAAYAPTEFSVVRLQAQRQFLPDGHHIDEVTAQLNVTIGNHPAHAY